MPVSRLSAPCRRLLPWLIAGLLAACGGGGSKSASQVAAKVNDGEITVHQVELLSERERALSAPERSEAISRAKLDELVELELAAQAAREMKLDSSPRVVQLLEASRREVLARAWQDRVSESARHPSADEVDRYYDTHPALFAQRRVYALVETVVGAPRDAVPALKARIEASTSPQQLAEALSGEGIRSSARNLRAAAEDLPLAMLERVAALKPGQTLAVPRDNGLRLLSLASSELQPVDRKTAQPMIVAFLLNERRLELIREAAAGLRQKARIELRPPFAASAPAAAASR